jgi:hypothetical protein
MRTQLHLRPFAGALPVPLCAEDDVSYADWQQYFGEVSVAVSTGSDQIRSDQIGRDRV